MSVYHKTAGESNSLYITGIRKALTEKQLDCDHLPMRLKTIEAFEKHLIQSSPEHRSPIYLLLIEDPFERRYYAEKIYRFLQKECKELSLEKGKDALSHLFASQHRLVVIDPCEEMKSLISELSYISPGTRVVLGAPSIEKDLCHQIEKIGIVLDLLDEKPWEKKSRFQEEALKLVKRERKTIAPEALSLLVEMTSTFPFLKNEIDKVITYVGSKTEITLADVKAIGCKEGEDSSWEIAEALVLGTDTKMPICKDTSTLLNLLWQVRYYANLALQWKVDNAPPKELKGSRLERFRKRVEKKNTQYFLNIERALFDLEVKAKDGAKDPQGLWKELLIDIASLT